MTVTVHLYLAFGLRCCRQGVRRGMAGVIHAPTIVCYMLTVTNMLVWCHTLCIFSFSCKHCILCLRYYRYAMLRILSWFPSCKSHKIQLCYWWISESSGSTPFIFGMVPRSNLSPEVSYPDWAFLWFSSVLPCMCNGGTSD